MSASAPSAPSPRRRSFGLRSCLRFQPFLAALCAAFVATLAARAEPLSLEEAIKISLQNNPRIHVSAFSRDISRASLLQQYGFFDPAITFRRTYSQSQVEASVLPTALQFNREDDYSVSLDGNSPWGLTYSLGGSASNVPVLGRDNLFHNNFVTFGGLSVTEPLLRGFGLGSTLANVRIAKANRAISDWQHKQTVIDTVTNVIFAYNDVILARDDLRIAKLSRDLAAQLLDENEKRNRIGALSDADVIQARARVANREESVLFAARAVTDSENELRALLGEKAFSLTGQSLDVLPLPPAPPLTVSLETDLKQAYNQRPDYQAARLGLTKVQVNDTLARNQLLPRVDFVGRYGYQGFDPNFSAARSQVNNEDHRAYSAGLVVTVPLTFAEGRGRARAARLTLRQSEADLQRMEQDIAVSVTAAAGQIDTTQQRVAATTRAYELAKQALDAEQKRFRAGTSRTLDVLQLQEQLASVEASQVRARSDARRALASYDRELGATLARFQIKLD